MGNATTCRASPQGFSKILEPYGRHRARSGKSDMGFLRFWDHRRLVDSRTGSCEFPIGSHTGHRPMGHVRALKCPVLLLTALKCPVWVLTAPCGSAFKTTVHGSCGLCTGA